MTSPTIYGASTEGTCERCHGPNVTWFTPNAVWNAVFRRAGCPEEPRIICPVCFIKAAEETGMNTMAWKVEPEQ